MLDYDAATHLRLHLTELPDLITAAEIDLQPSGAQATGSRVSGATRTPPLPLNLAMFDLLLDTEQVVASWAAAIRDELRSANHWDGWRLYACLSDRPTVGHVRYLLHVHDFAITRAVAADYAAELHQAHRALAGATGLLARRPARMVCPRCRLLTMQTRPDGLRECCNPDCWAIQSASEYANRTERLLAELDAAA